MRHERPTDVLLQPLSPRIAGGLESGAKWSRNGEARGGLGRTAVEKKAAFQVERRNCSSWAGNEVNGLSQKTRSCSWSAS